MLKRSIKIVSGKSRLDPNILTAVLYESYSEVEIGGRFYLKDLLL
jgi:hypothetical protein